MRPEDLDLLHSVGDPRLRPGTREVAYVVETMDTSADTTRSRIHLHDGVEDRVLTAGPEDHTPRWSPDGSRLAFLRAPALGESAQLAVLRADGGEAELVTELELGCNAFDWTPDGTALVVAAADRPEALAELTPDELAQHPRRITSRVFRGDDRGWFHDRVVRLFHVPLDGGEVRALTPPDHDAADPVVTPDGSAVVFRSARHDDVETYGGTGVWRVPLAGGAPEELLGAGDQDELAVAADGSVLFSGLLDPFEWPRPHRLLRVAPDGTATDLAPTLDRDVVGSATGPTPLDDGGVLVGVEDRGAVHLVRVDPDGTHEVLVGGAQEVTGWSVEGDASLVAYTATHPTDPGELWLLEDGEPRVLTAHNEELRERLLPVRHLTFERDGVELDGWLVLPEGDDSDVPLLLNIHGGPTAQYGHAFFDEFQVEAGAGYAVFGCNPRGSSGRGADWATAVVGAWVAEDSVDTLDLEAAVDAALAAEPRISRDRLGIMGGSYGGYATARILARTDRFRSAIVERGLLNWISFGGTSDIGAFFDRIFLQLGLPGDAEQQWLASPVRTADRITTPTLVLHSLEDHRCPPEQAYQLFSILRRNGVESELLLFPGESHELSRSGSPRHRLQRFEAVLDWHDRYLRD